MPDSPPASAAQVLPRGAASRGVVLVRTGKFWTLSAAEDVRELAARPIVLRTKVCRGFGRGGKQLGVPTANVEEHVVASVNPDVTGVFLGWAKVRGRVHKAVASVGWNPVFGNEKKTIEPYLLADFDSDFYGEDMALVLCGYIRPERGFESLQALKDAIWLDIETARAALDEPRFAKYGGLLREDERGE